MTVVDQGCPEKVGVVHVLDVPVQAHTMDTIMRRIEELIETPGCSTAYAVNAHSLNLACGHPCYWRCLQTADLVYADGASIQLAARVLRQRIPQRLTTTDLYPPLCDLAVRRGYRFFLLGGEQGLADRARAASVARHPGLRIVGVHHGYFAFDDESVVARINAAQADVLWVGMGDPRQVLWAESVRARLHARLIITCGGMFKIVTGDLARSPEIWRRWGFEWVGRLIHEPGATWRRYLLGLPAFGFRIAAQLLMRARESPGAR